MKILIIITDLGSFNNFLAELAIECSKKHELHIICSYDNIICIKNKYNYSQYAIFFHEVSIPRSFSIINLFKASNEIRNLIKSINPNIVHAHFTTGILPSILLKVDGIPYMGTFHGLGLNASTGFRRLVFFIVEFYCFLRLDKIILINNKDFAFVNTLFKNKVKKPLAYGVGCDLLKFNKSNFTKEDKLSFKKNLGIKDEFVITYTGRFVEFKGFDMVYKSFKLIESRFPNKFILLLIGGSDPIHKTGLSTKELNELSINKSIINIGFTSTVEKYLAISDLFLFPSKKEGLPVCIMESLAMGVPVLSLEERGNSDLIMNDFNGFLIESISKKNDINAITSKIEYFFKNKKTLTLFSLNGLSEREKYSRDHFINEHIELYSNMLNQHKLNK